MHQCNIKNYEEHHEMKKSATFNAKVFPCNTNSLFVYKMKYIELKLYTRYSRKQIISDLLGFDEDEVQR